MKTLTMGRLVSAACILASSLSAFADVTWDQVKKKVEDGKSYQVDYKYDGARGNFKFDYRAIVPGKIRSEIKSSSSDASRVGTVVVYDADWNKDKVRAKAGGGLLTRNTTHKEVAGTAFVKPVFSLVVEQAGSAKPTVTAEGGRTRFDFAGGYSVWANGAGDIVRTERKDGTSKEVREFNSIKWNSNPTISL